MDAEPYVVAPLDASTWPVFAALVEANGGVFGGCWCLGFHAACAGGSDDVPGHDRKETPVRTGGAHAALVLVDAGGGLVEGFPEPVGAVPAGLLLNGALSTYEAAGFVRQRAIGKHRWVVTRTVAPR